MGEYKGTWQHDEPAQLENIYETLHMTPSWYDDGVLAQSIAIASLQDKRKTSFIMAKFYDKNQPAFCHMIFTEEETDIIIDALQKAKKEMGKRERIIK